MKEPSKIPLVTTIKERCRGCYTCVRECPAKAIRITEGQADVVFSRCIGCGNCVQVCGQHAKQVYDTTALVDALLAGKDQVAAIIAPSFPAAFIDWPYQKVVGLFRKMGFDYVMEVAFGADLVSDRYRRLFEKDTNGHYIATSCPAIVSYVERYYPALVDALAPIVSPMTATARVVHHKLGPDIKVVFVGPCIAKKEETFSAVPEDVDVAISFEEAQRMMQARQIEEASLQPSEFDPPHGGLGALFPISRGLIQSARLTDDLIADDILVTDGRRGFVEAIKEFSAGQCKPRLLEVLACQGCIMGPGIVNTDPLFRRRSRVSQYVRERITTMDLEAWHRDVEQFAKLDLSQSYRVDDQRSPGPSPEELATILKHLGKISPEDELNCGACGYETCREHAIAIHKGLAEDEMCLPFIIDKLRETITSLAQSKEQLAQTQETLMHTEKLASMGQLAAGIAHELNNPLGVILMYAHMLLEGHTFPDAEMKEDIDMLVQQADRCKTIVSGLLHFARQHRTNLILVDLRSFIKNTLKAVSLPGDIKVDTKYEGGPFYTYLDRDQIAQVLTNLIINASHAMPEGGTLTIGYGSDDHEVRLSVNDTGTGIPKEYVNRIFEPFFTTKEAGKGTGMGLAVSYGIVKMHRGDLRVESNNDPALGPTGTTFTVILPKKSPSPGDEEHAEKLSQLSRVSL
ncbi:MAG TPA: [Fe-Fe] hydrogenase large subunit C-terminal domain-containing protein [Candidatus Hydrogenedentes bacterium]|nr:[Fe-Fe] hydrogenase large subunit C-terminal domain-containing protein [Candidatus Hydrogenedentota bacterium]